MTAAKADNRVMDEAFMPLGMFLRDSFLSLFRQSNRNPQHMGSARLGRNQEAKTKAQDGRLVERGWVVWGRHHA